MNFMLRIMFAVLKLGLLFVSEEEYTAKVATITTLDQKNEGFDLQGWEYRTITDPRTGFVHRYYRYPSLKPDAPTLLCVHGMNLDGRTFMHLRTLADEWELIAYDLPESTIRYAGHFDDFAEIVGEFADLLERPICGLCGVSFGGLVVTRIAATRREFDTKRLILISSMPVGVTREEQKRNRAMANWVRAQPDYKVYWVMETMAERQNKGFRRETGRRRSIGEIMRMKHIDFYRQVSSATSAINATLDAREVRCPTLVLVGSRDDLIAVDKAHEFVDYIPRAEFEIIEGGTHAMTYQRGEDVAERIRAFCDRHRD